MGKLAFMAQDRWLAPSSFLLLLAAYHLIFGQFFPTKNGTLGHDYSRILPDLLDGYFWIKSNGFFEPYWFTPAFCGGQPLMGDQASTFYSVTQILTFFVDPLASVYATVLLFASLGFWGFYLLLRSCFSTSTQAALLGGALIMFNGFFIHRMMVGHLTFHGVMLIPWIAYFLLRSTRKSVSTTMINGAAAGCMFAYGTYSGLASLLLPSAVSIVTIACIHGLTGRESSGFVQRSLVAALVAIGLSSAKLAATFSFLQNFPRSDYALPGVTNVWDALHLLFSTLFFSPADIAERAQPLVAGMQWMLDRHEWEYGVTVVPLLIILIGTMSTLVHIQIVRPRLNLTRYVYLVLIVCVLALPLALNIYTPDWNAFLKQVPVIKSSSTLVRWFLVYIPIVILSASLLFDKISPQQNRRNSILIAALVALLVINVVKDRAYYQAQPYQPDTIEHAWWTAHTSTLTPRIEHISAFVDANNRIQMTGNRNDEIATWGSQLACYNPIFGYRLEHFPVKTLHPGSVLEETNGLLNIKNPACYLYPKQNNCSPGDHFTVAQRKAAIAFTSYKPYPFKFSPAQNIANWITHATLMLLVLLFVVVLVQKALRSVNIK